jgi:hypothetical protein
MVVADGSVGAASLLLLVVGRGRSRCGAALGYGEAGFVAGCCGLMEGNRESLRERGSRVKREMGRWVSGRRRWDAVWSWLLCFV